jgi:DNA end-binding protein Ku
MCNLAPGKSLMLLTLRFADEVLPAAGSSATAKISAADLSMPKQLVQNMQGNFNASKFKDTYRADLKRRVQEKIRKKETHSLDVEEPKGEERPKALVIDLVAALKASLKESGASANEKRRRNRQRRESALKS